VFAHLEKLEGEGRVVQWNHMPDLWQQRS